MQKNFHYFSLVRSSQFLVALVRTNKAIRRTLGQIAFSFDIATGVNQVNRPLFGEQTLEEQID